MSSDTRRPLAEARALAARFLALLADAAPDAEIAGSLRREKPDIGDIDLVAPASPALLARLDALVQDGVIAKARYGAAGTPRWGERYRGCVYEGVKVEVFTYDAANRGVVQWLRTGPGDANTEVLQQLGRRRAPARFQDGYAWLGAWTWDAARKAWTDPARRRLHLPDEAALFALLGLPVIPPPARSLDHYRTLLAAPGHAWGDPRPYLDAPASPPPQQTALFSAEAMRDLEWQVAVERARHEAPGPSTVLPLLEWVPPWLCDDGCVWVWEVCAGVGRWRKVAPTDPSALAYQRCHSPRSVRWRTERDRLKAWLESGDAG